jgi:Polyketide cyclase / dehydrase and lipid transport
MFATAHHFESVAFVPAIPQAVFSYVDDHERLSSHMTRSSWMMGGGRMHVQLDAARGRQTGSHIRMSGRAFGLELALEEVVSEYDPPRHKSWETVGEPRLLIIGRYRMGFDIAPQSGGSDLRVFIDYELPPVTRGRWLIAKLVSWYAAWCTQRMVKDAVLHFSVRPVSNASLAQR